MVVNLERTTYKVIERDGEYFLPVPAFEWAPGFMEHLLSLEFVFSYDGYGILYDLPDLHRYRPAPSVKSGGGVKAADRSPDRVCKYVYPDGQKCNAWRWTNHSSVYCHTHTKAVLERASLPIEELELSARPYNSLQRVGIETIGDLLVRSEESLLLIPNFGATSLAEVKEALRDTSSGKAWGEIVE